LSQIPSRTVELAASQRAAAVRTIVPLAVPLKADIAAASVGCNKRRDWDEIVDDPVA
jgi:hypothetical protein